MRTITKTATNRAVAEAWEFVSESDAEHYYETLRQMDGKLTCNCPGWTRRIAVDGSRTCKHTRWVSMGAADRHAVAHVNYRDPKPAVRVAVSTSAPAQRAIGASNRKLVTD